MNDLLHNLIEALREELKQYGEMLAVLEQQQDSVVQRQANELLQNISQGSAQGDIIAAVRHERGQHQRNVARMLGLDEAATFAAIIPRLPADYRPAPSDDPSRFSPEKIPLGKGWSPSAPIPPAVSPIP